MRSRLPLLALLLVAGCGAGRSAPVRSYGPDEVALRVEVVGGFVPAQASATTLPGLSVYGDGRVISVGATPAIFPGPALPSLQVRHISPTGVSRLVDLAVTAGVGRAGDLGQPPVADAGSTRFTVRDGGTVKATSVYALGIAGDGLTATQRAGRSDLQALYAALTDLPRTLGAGAIGHEQRYGPTQVAAVAVAWTDPGQPGLPAPPEVAWPGPPLPGPPLPANTALGCVSAAGDEASRILAAAAGANALTPWTSGGQRWTVALRPLLPDESGCADLGR